MRIKNKKTGELIEVPPHLESDVKAIIAKGGDPMVILNIDVPEAKSGIHIKPENRGKFNATKKRTGKSTEELTHSKNPLTRKRAIFALNSKSWSNKKYGGFIEGNEYDLSLKEIKKLELLGYKLEY